MPNVSELYGSLVISANTPIRQFPQLEGSKPLHGSHTESRHKGLFSTLVTGDHYAEATVALPQRNKYMQITVVRDDLDLSPAIAADLLRTKLSDLDSRFEGSRQLFKLSQLMDEIAVNPGCMGYAAVVNNTSEHATFSLLSSYVTIYLYGVYDTVNSSVRLVWTTDETFIEQVRRADPVRYVFYRFPVVYTRPLFIYTQSICSKWYQWTKVFTGVDGLVKAFNALEIFLFKDPSVNSYER
jgi:hypothetical protein